MSAGDFTWVEPEVSTRGMMGRLFDSWVRSIEEAGGPQGLYYVHEYSVPGPSTVGAVIGLLGCQLGVLAKYDKLAGEHGVILRTLAPLSQATVCLVELVEGGALRTENGVSTRENGRWTVMAVSRDPELATKLGQVFKKDSGFTGRTEVAMLEKGQRGYHCMTVGTVAAAFERGNYLSYACAAFDEIVAEFQKKEPAGRLVLLEGPPGTGKTRFVKGLMSACELPTLLLPAKHIGLVEEGAVLACIRAWATEARESTSPAAGVLLVIEDADSILVPRQADNMSALSALLNASDGLLGEVADLRVVVTTNSKKTEVDTAVTRDGRMFRHVRLGLLPPEKAVEIVRRVAPEMRRLPAPIPGGHRLYSLAQCYAIARGAASWFATET